MTDNFWSKELAAKLFYCIEKRKLHVDKLVLPSVACEQIAKWNEGPSLWNAPLAVGDPNVLVRHPYFDREDFKATIKEILSDPDFGPFLPFLNIKPS